MKIDVLVVILAESAPLERLGLAVLDRLTRASGYKTVKTSKRFWK